MFEVYQLIINPKYGDIHQEQWNIEKVALFKQEEWAKLYIRAQSRACTEMPRFLIDILDPNDEDEFIEQFCFTNDLYLIYRRLFLGLPPVGKIKDALKEHGIVVLKNTTASRYNLIILE